VSRADETRSKRTKSTHDSKKEYMIILQVEGILSEYSDVIIKCYRNITLNVLQHHTDTIVTTINSRL
jgi:hypothetical protein